MLDTREQEGLVRGAASFKASEWLYSANDSSELLTVELSTCSDHHRNQLTEIQLISVLE